MYAHAQNCSVQRLIRPSMLSLEANGTLILVLRSKSFAVPKTWTHRSIDAWMRFIVRVSTCDFQFFSEQRPDDQHSFEDMILLVYSLRSETAVTTETSAEHATPVKGKSLLYVGFFCIFSAPGYASVSKCWSETITAHFVEMKGCDNSVINHSHFSNSDAV